MKRSSGSRRLRITACWLSLALTSVLSAACNAQPTDSGSQTPPSHPPERPSIALPPRPTTLSLTGLKPCDLLAPDQLIKLDVDSIGAENANSDQFGSPACYWSNAGQTPDNQFFIRLVTRQGVDAALKSGKPYQIIDVDGFPAIQIAGLRLDPKIHCVDLVDVAPGQQLWVQYLNLAGDYPNISHEVACRQSKYAASMAVATLRTRRH